MRARRARLRLDLDQVDGPGTLVGVEVDEREARRLLPHAERAAGPDGAAVDEDVGALALDVLAVVVAGEDEHRLAALRGQLLEQPVRERVPVDEHDVGPLGQGLEPVEELLLRVEERLLLQLEQAALEAAGRALAGVVPARDREAGDLDDRARRRSCRPRAAGRSA